MSVFGYYSKYYDLLYKDKDYGAEADYIQRCIHKFAPGAKSVLELGCGTGKHACLLAKNGFTITGVDMSGEMLEEANKRKEIEKIGSISFVEGNIQTVRLQKKFDSVISLFHVISYQTGNEHLEAAFKTAAVHLNDKGLFIFDCWYGPAVLTDRPAVRCKRLENETIRVVRIAEPVMYPDDNLVDVNYHLFITEKATGKVQELHETHKMRYLFKPEIEYFLSNSGFSLVHSEEWLTSRTLDFSTWGAVFIAKVD
jgi:SAM-dependent methyltransferase